MFDEVLCKLGSGIIAAGDGEVTARMARLNALLTDGMRRVEGMDGDVAGRLSGWTQAVPSDGPLPLTAFGSFGPPAAPGDRSPSDMAAAIARGIEDLYEARIGWHLKSMAALEPGTVERSVQLGRAKIEQAAAFLAKADLAKALFEAAGATGRAAQVDGERAFWAARLDACRDVWNWSAVMSAGRSEIEHHVYAGFIGEPAPADAERLVMTAEALSEEAQIHIDEATDMTREATARRADDRIDERAYGAIVAEAGHRLRKAAALAVRCNEYWGALAKLAHMYPGVFGSAFGGRDLVDVSMRKPDIAKFLGGLTDDGVRGALEHEWGKAAAGLTVHAAAPVVKRAGEMGLDVHAAASAYGFGKAAADAGLPSERIAAFAGEKLGDRLPAGFVAECLVAGRLEADAEIGLLNLYVASEAVPYSEPASEAEARRIAGLAAGDEDDDGGEGQPGSIGDWVVGVQDAAAVEWSPTDGDWDSPSLVFRPPRRMLKQMGL